MLMDATQITQLKKQLPGTKVVVIERLGVVWRRELPNEAGQWCL